MLVKTPIENVEQVSIIKAVNFSINSYKKNGSLNESKTAQLLIEQREDCQILLEIIVDADPIWDDSMDAEYLHDELSSCLDEDEAEAIEKLICLMKLHIM